MTTVIGKRTTRGVRSIRLTSRGLMFAVTAAMFAVVAYSSGNRILLLVSGLLASLVIAAAILARFRSMNLSIARRFSPSPVSATAETTVTVDLSNLAGIRSAPLYWNDTLPWQPLATDPERMDSLSPSPGHFTVRARKLSYQLMPPRRGVFEIGPLQVAYSDPFGLAVGFLSIGGRTPLVVTPRVVELPTNGIWLEAPDGAARLVQAVGVGNSDDLMTREYRRGDALRRVHWRASARHGELMVRQEEQRAYPEATIALDTQFRGYDDVLGGSHPDFAGAPLSESFEWGVTMLASLALHLHHAGFVVHVVETAKPQVARLADQESRFGREENFLLSLARVELSRAAGIVRRASAAGPVFAILSNPDAVTVTSLIDLRRPFELGVVFLIGGAEEVAAEFHLAGWRVIPVSTRTSPAITWGVLAEELGLSNVAG